jgi:hypothetical protein
MYDVWYPFLSRIDRILMPTDDNGVTSVFLKGDDDFISILEDKPGWVSMGNSYMYLGSNADAMYDSIQTIFRMYYAYEPPIITNVGVIYYDT